MHVMLFMYLKGGGKVLLMLLSAVFYTIQLSESNLLVRVFHVRLFRASLVAVPVALACVKIIVIRNSIFSNIRGKVESSALRAQKQTRNSTNLKLLPQVVFTFPRFLLCLTIAHFVRTLAKLICVACQKIAGIVQLCSPKIRIVCVQSSLVLIGNSFLSNWNEQFKTS